MPTLKAKLSTDSIDALLKDLKVYGQKVMNAPVKMIKDLTDYGRDEIKANLGSITDMDGNYLAEAGSYVYGNTGFAFMKGEQAKFLEYGTGEVGKSQPHPKAGNVGWQYDNGDHIRKRKNGKRMWVYYDKLKGHYRTTNGIPAQMPVLKAVIKVRGRILRAAKEALK